jgi:hypothetical protein
MAGSAVSAASDPPPPPRDPGYSPAGRPPLRVSAGPDRPPRSARRQALQLHARADDEARGDAGTGLHSRPQSRRDQGAPFRSGGQPGQRFGEPGAERSGRGANPQGGHGQRDPVPAGRAQHGGCQQGGSASHGQIRAAKCAPPGPLIPPGGRRAAMGAAGDRYTSAHADNSERREDATGLHRDQASPSRAASARAAQRSAGSNTPRPDTDAFSSSRATLLPDAVIAAESTPNSTGFLRAADNLPAPAGVLVGGKSSDRR